ncbi:hypothetical protein D9758_017197 [Tetrapyrgos nigripes]|uniref:Uncharacterized protein n=1 Tax=Tetrapyrgos nigripes TaxID=182062 RepID=A0A8H5FC98_9AGAR|nr:hypothetical protein D9758_017197 [Tetrapyrgos nigripes]
MPAYSNARTKSFLQAVTLNGSATPDGALQEDIAGLGIGTCMERSGSSGKNVDMSTSTPLTPQRYRYHPPIPSDPSIPNARGFTYLSRYSALSSFHMPSILQLFSSRIRSLRQALLELSGPFRELGLQEMKKTR